MIAGKAQRSIIPTSKAIAKQAIEELVKRSLESHKDNKGLSEKGKKEFVKRAVKRRFPKTTSKEVEKFISKESKKIKEK